jgi:hypothetical protein
VKTLLILAAAVPLVAQDLSLQLQKVREEADVRMKMLGAVRGATVKGAPYSGEEVSETNQTLADGTRIHRENHAMVYRDSEGRTRRETPENITISDPVAGATYILNPKTMTGQKLNMAAGVFAYRSNEGTVTTHVGPGTTSSTVTMRVTSDGGSPTITVNGEKLDPQAVQEYLARAKANGDHIFVSQLDGLSDAKKLAAEAAADAKKMAAAGPLPVLPEVIRKARRGESLGKQTIEGVEAEGTRTTNTIKAGEIGNDRDIQVTGESWFSAELKTTVMSKHSDPRTGEESFRLINIRRGDPGAYLFQPPSGYTIRDLADSHK